jgi:UDP-galactopyranose mutase
MQFDIVVVGAGISGVTLAERFANQLNKKVLIIEKRDHIAGNCFDYTNSAGIMINKYGPHYFHTNDEFVWNYVNKFSKWVKYEARVLSHVENKKVPVPVNIDTINILFGTNLKTEDDIKKWFEEEAPKIDNPKNSEESALKRMGKRLYEMMFKNYTTKQWDKSPKELEASVMDRIPVRYNHDNRYFTDKYQAYPKEGYTRIFEKMLESQNITVKLNTSWKDVKTKINNFEKLFFTGPIDAYFDESLGKLEYRSLRFEPETLNMEFFQTAVQENYPDINFPFTRIVEYKHQTKQKNPKTTIVREYPTWDGDPYYPIPSERNRKIFKKYQEKALALEKKNIYFVGRLANYKYFNMDQAFKNALDLFERLNK